MTRPTGQRFPRAVHLATPIIIDASVRKSVGELQARIGELVARKLFAARGNNAEVHLSERELAMICATAAHVSTFWEQK